MAWPFDVRQRRMQAYMINNFKFNEINFIEASIKEDDRIYLLEQSIDLYLEANIIDCSFYDIKTGNTIF